MEGQSVLQLLGQSRVFVDGDRIGMDIGSDRREGLEAMLEAEASILTIEDILILPPVGIYST